MPESAGRCSPRTSIPVTGNQSSALRPSRYPRPERTAGPLSTDQQSRWERRRGARRCQSVRTRSRLRPGSARSRRLQGSASNVRLSRSTLSRKLLGATTIRNSSPSPAVVIKGCVVVTGGFGSHTCARGTHTGTHPPIRCRTRASPRSAPRRSRSRSPSTRAESRSPTRPQAWRFFYEPRWCSLSQSPTTRQTVRESMSHHYGRSVARAPRKWANSTTVEGRPPVRARAAHRDDRFRATLQSNEDLSRIT